MAKRIKKEPIYYTYLIGWSWLDMWYYGSQYGSKAHPDNLWVTYFTSSKHVTNFRAEHGEPDVRIIIKEDFKTREETRSYEARVLTRINAAKHPHMLNRHNGNSRFISDCTGKAAAIHVVTGERLGLVEIRDPRWESGEIKAATTNNGHTKGKAAAVDSVTGQRLGSIDTSDPRWITGEIVPTAGAKKGVQPKNSNGKAPAKLAKTGETLGWIDKADIRWKTGEIIFWGAGRKAARLAATGEVLGKIELSDLRWTTGEIIGINQGKKAAVLASSGEKIGLVDLKDIRWSTGEIRVVGGAQ